MSICWLLKAIARPVSAKPDESKLVEFLKDVKDLPAHDIKAKVQEEYKRQFPREIEKL